MIARAVVTPAGEHQSSRFSWANSGPCFATMSTSTAPRGIGVGVVFGRGVAVVPLAAGPALADGGGEASGGSVSSGGSVTSTVGRGAPSGRGPAIHRALFDWSARDS